MGPVTGPNNTFNAVVYSGAPSATPVFQHVSVPGPVPIDRQLETATTGPNAREEEMEDDEEWQIREGNAPPPAWAKRKADEDDRGSNKRSRTRYFALFGSHLNG